MAGPLRLSKGRVLGIMGRVRPLFRDLCEVSSYSDDAIADALLATARGDPEWWFGAEHIRAAYLHLLSNRPLINQST